MRKGITFTGELFVVPETHDMVKTLFDPTVRKSMFEMVIVVLLAANACVFWLVPGAASRINVFVGFYVFWRLSYNFGIGYLLNQQLKLFRLVLWARKWRLFEAPALLVAARVIQTEVQTQMGQGYNVQKYPDDFNTWLVFRKVVDLILMQDFTAFVCLVVACATADGNQFLHGQPSWLIAARLLVGSCLIVFNLWVKVNAHNTIKDYAWYWGDFFFRQINNDDLIFDGVFEMFPHPMYLVGYVGYYGFALIAKSYTVLVVAVFGHFLQMVFLHYIENPHIDKVYGPLPNELSLLQLLKLKDLTHFDNAKPLVGLANFSVLRASDVINAINVLTYAVLIPLLAVQSSASAGRVLFYLTVVVKTAECVGVNTVLLLQSRLKYFTKWYLANNVPVEHSLSNFAIFYNSLVTFTYAAFFGMNLYAVLCEPLVLFGPEYFYLRVFLGVMLIFTQAWINASIIDLIGYFGWFYGDFFIPRSSLMSSQLTKAGVYRYLNNPEQIFGVCGVVGVTLIVPTYDNIVMAAMWVLSNFVRINWIEKSHMIKIYGEQEVLQDSGVTKTVKKHLLPEGFSRRLSTTDRKKGRALVFMDSLDTFIKELVETRPNHKQSVCEMSHSKHFLNSEYFLEVSGFALDDWMPVAYIGDKLTVSFTAPAGHSAEDWIGLYKITHTLHSKYKTLVSSNGRWAATGPLESGLVEFSGDKLFWAEGIYEFRYHLAGKHDVASICEPFEIRSPTIEVPTHKDDAAELAAELKRKIFDKIGDFAVDTPVYSVVLKTADVIKTYTRIAEMISMSTGLQVSKRFVMYNDNELRNTLTIHDLALKLIHIQGALSELTPEDEKVKKTQ